MPGPPDPWERADGARRGRARDRRSSSRRIPQQRRSPENRPSEAGHAGWDAAAADPRAWQQQAGWEQSAGAPHGWDQQQAGWDQQAWDQQQAGWDRQAWDQQQAGWDQQAWDQQQAGWDQQQAGWSGGGDHHGGWPEPHGWHDDQADPRDGQVYGGRPDPAFTDDADDEPRTARRRSRAPRWALVNVIVGAVLLVFGGGSALASVILMDRYTTNIEQGNLLGGAAVDPGQSLEGPINVLLLGLDGREADTDDTRSDTIIVLHVPSSHDQAYMISVPRDTWVNVPGYWEMKITEAFYHGNKDGGWNGGAQLVAQSLHELTGISFNAAAIVNFGGFEKIIDEMGGLDFCVETAAISEHFVLVNGERMGVGRARREGHWPQEPVRYEVGCQHLEGWQALDYVRQRKNLETHEGDYARQRHQQQLLHAMADRATSGDVLSNVGMMDRLLRATGDALVIDTNQVDMVDFAFTMRHIRPGNLMSLQTNEGWYNSAEINGVSAEVLTDLSLAMFRAAAEDNMAYFVLQNPEVLND